MVSISSFILTIIYQFIWPWPHSPFLFWPNSHPILSCHHSARSSPVFHTPLLSSLSIPTKSSTTCLANPSSIRARSLIWCVPYLGPLSRWLYSSPNKHKCQGIKLWRSYNMVSILVRSCILCGCVSAQDNKCYRGLKISKFSPLCTVKSPNPTFCF
jgi:hypothetical protein